MGDAWSASAPPTAQSPCRRLSGAALLATGLFVAAMCGSSLVILLFLTNVTFIVDEWDFLLHRRGFSADVVFEPHNEHISVLPVLIYKALLGTFGMDSARPFQIVSIALFLAMVAVLFVFLRRRMGEWLALAAVLPVLFLGGSYDTLLFPFQIGFFLARSASESARRSRSSAMTATAICWPPAC